MMKRRKKWILGIVLALLIALVWDNTRIVTDSYTFSDAALPNGFEGFRIVQLSDLHGRTYGAKLTDAVAAAQPDLIVLTGDFVDKHTVPATLEEDIRSLAALAPTYYVTGNHEWGAHKAKETLAYFTAWGVTCLQNEYVSIERGEDRIFLAGIHDPNGYADQKAPEEVAGELYAAEGDPYWLLLAHRSSRFPDEYAPLGANLTLSGHLHGGIFRVPVKGGSVFAPFGLLTTLTEGFYEHEGETVFVSRGLGNSPIWLPRVFNPPQVAVITLTKEAVS